MADFFLDSSALVKRYINEPGSVFIDQLIDPSRENDISIAEITRVEVASAIARRTKGKTLTEKDAAVALKAFTVDFDDLLIKIEVTSELIESSADLATKHALRGYDAVQLAAALAANHDLIAAGLDELQFVSADSNLNQAAIAEGLTVENPNDD